MKKAVICVFVILLLLLSREWLAPNLSAYSSEFTSMGDGGGGVPAPYNVSGVSYEESPSKPVSVNAKNHDSADSGSVVVRYRIFSNLTWKRWIPLYKSGLNIVRIEYTVGHSSHSGTHCGYWQEETNLTVKGLCSASKYERLLREAAFKRMKKHLDPRFNIYTPNAPAANPIIPIANENGSSL